MKFRKSARRDTPEVNLIAFIDVLLVILIFLMVSTTFSKFSALKLSLPTATTNPEQAQPKTVSVAIDASGSVTVDSRRLGLIEPKTLAAALKQVVGANTDSVVEIHADAMATHQSVVQRLSFATRNPPR
jgi:biopolymer transport protein ExbD